MNNYLYKMGSATTADISTHLFECKENFVPDLDLTVDIPDYVKKIEENALTFEAWHKQKLIGLIAAYFNDPDRYTGFITNVSVLKIFYGRGIASKLLSQCISYGKENSFKRISLKVHEQNFTAIGLYKKFHFVPAGKESNSHEEYSLML